MKGVVSGYVAEVKPRSYVNGEGAVVEVFDAHIGEGRFFDRISGPKELMPVVGQHVAFVAIISAKKSRAGNAYLSVWATEDANATSKAA